MIYEVCKLVLYTHAAAKKTTAVRPTESSSNDDSGLRHGFDASAPLPLNQIAPITTPADFAAFLLHRGNTRSICSHFV